DRSPVERRAATARPFRRYRGPAPSGRGQAGPAQRHADARRGPRAGRAGRCGGPHQGRRRAEVAAPGRRRARDAGDGAAGHRAEPPVAGARQAPVRRPGGGVPGRRRCPARPLV
ncbi:MAG: integration host factor, partial [uncultured Friedmanniella sp.]